jgi:hypothetical protein
VLTQVQQMVLTHRLVSTVVPPPRIHRKPEQTTQGNLLHCSRELDLWWCQAQSHPVPRMGLLVLMLALLPEPLVLRQELPPLVGRIRRWRCSSLLLAQLHRGTFLLLLQQVSQPLALRRAGCPDSGGPAPSRAKWPVQARRAGCPRLPARSGYLSAARARYRGLGQGRLEPARLGLPQAADRTTRPGSRSVSH